MDKGKTQNPQKSSIVRTHIYTTAERQKQLKNAAKQMGLTPCILYRMIINNFLDNRNAAKQP